MAPSMRGSACYCRSPSASDSPGWNHEARQNQSVRSMLQAAGQSHFVGLALAFPKKRFLSLSPLVRCSYGETLEVLKHLPSASQHVDQCFSPTRRDDRSHTAPFTQHQPSAIDAHSTASLGTSLSSATARNNSLNDLASREPSDHQPGPPRNAKTTARLPPHTHARSLGASEALETVIARHIAPNIHNHITHLNQVSNHS